MAEINPPSTFVNEPPTNNLFVGGSFTSVDGNSISANNIASWDGNSWNILGTNSTNNGVNGYVSALAMNGTNQLFVEFGPNILHEFPSQDAILLAEINDPSTLVNEPPTNKLFVPFIATTRINMLEFQFLIN